MATNKQAKMVLQKDLFSWRYLQIRGLVKLNLQKSKIDYTALSQTLYLLTLGGVQHFYICFQNLPLQGI